MKRVVLALVALVSIAMVSRAEYNALLLTYDDESQQIVNIEGLTITSTEDNLVFTNVDGVAEVAVNNLATIEFVDYNVTAIEDICADAMMQATVVYDMDGKLCGRFKSLAEAINRLQNGMYVMRAVNGKTLKIAVRK